MGVLLSDLISTISMWKSRQDLRTRPAGNTVACRRCGRMRELRCKARVRILLMTNVVALV